MANVKITDLTTHTNPASTDVLPIVDVGADVTKKVSIADLLKNAGFGTEALPGIAFDGDPNTGITRPGEDELAISTAGTERLRITSDGELGLGTNNPAALLEVNGTGYVTDLLIRNNSGTPSLGTSPWLYSPGNGELAIAANANERARIDSSGRLLVNTSTTLGQNELVQIARSDAGDHFGIFSFDATDGGQPAEVNLSRSKSDTIGTGTALAVDDALGAINFRGYDGDNFSLAARITAAADGEFNTSGDTTDSPGRLVFSVTADGASLPTEAMRIKNSGIINIANTPVYADNAAAKTGGLVDGDVYRTSTGDLKIVYT